MSVKAIATAALLLASAGCPLPRADAFFVTGATLPEPFLTAEDSATLKSRPRSERGFVAVRGHRIGPGAHTVLAYRRFSSGNWFAFDDEGFEKLTIELPDSLVAAGRHIDLASHPEVVVRYSRGAAVWVDATCYGRAREGELDVVRRTGRWIEARLQAPVELAECGRVELRRRLVLEEKDVDRLSPWDGRAGWTGRFPVEETFP